MSHICFRYIIFLQTLLPLSLTSCNKTLYNLSHGREERTLEVTSVLMPCFDFNSEYSEIVQDANLELQTGIETSFQFAAE
jgi:hypothetical protein